VLTDLYLDRIDIEGLFYWYDDALEEDRQVKEKTNGGNK